MKLILKGWEFTGEYREPISHELTACLESIFPSTDSRAMPFMAAVRKGNGLLFGQVPNLLDKFKVPYEMV